MQAAGERDVIAGIRPGALRVVPDGLKARVDLVEDLGDMAVLDLDCAGTAMRDARQPTKIATAKAT